MMTNIEFDQLSEIDGGNCYIPDLIDAANWQLLGNFAADVASFFRRFCD
jgi:hypothetical protein